MHRFTCRLPQDLYNHLNVAASKDGVPLAEKARQILASALVPTSIPKPEEVCVESYCGAFTMPEAVFDKAMYLLWSYNSKIQCIKHLREHLNCSLREGKAITECLPAPTRDAHNKCYVTPEAGGAFYLDSRLVVEACKMIHDSRDKGIQFAMDAFNFPRETVEQIIRENHWRPLSTPFNSIPVETHRGTFKVPSYILAEAVKLRRQGKIISSVKLLRTTCIQNLADAKAVYDALPDSFAKSAR